MYLPPKPWPYTAACALCGNEIEKRGRVYGLCAYCDMELGGGKFSARIVKQEAKAFAEGLNTEEGKARRRERRKAKA